MMYEHIQGSSIMAIYVQTVASYIFQAHFVGSVQSTVRKKNVRDIIVPIHDAIMIECNDKGIAQNVAQLMKDTANQLFNGEFAHVTVEALGGIDNKNHGKRKKSSNSPKYIVKRRVYTLLRFIVSRTSQVILNISLRMK